MSPIRVVKVGGSLLEWPLLPQALPTWLASQGAATNVLIAGGGAMADTIRRADAAFGLGEGRSHDLCLEVMGVTARLLADVLAERAALVSQLESISSASDSESWVVLDVRPFMRQPEPQSSDQQLPQSWDVTSDSIAARVAAALQADELILLKSREPPRAGSFAELSASGLVDRFFPTAAADFGGQIRLVNLRATRHAALAAR